MYLSIPRTFLVPIYWIKIDTLDFENVVFDEENDYYSVFINRIVNRKDIKIGVSLPAQREVRWVRDKEGMENQAKEKGVDILIENADFDVAKQTEQVDRLLSQGIDVLILAPIDKSDKEKLVEKAKSKGIKVISYEALLQNSNPDLYIAINNLRVGELQGRYLIEHVPKGKYILLSGENGEVFKEGAMEYIQPLVDIGNIKIVGDRVIRNWDPKIAYETVKEILIANKNKVDAILAPNDAIAGAAIEALRERGLAGKVAVTGQDAELAAVRRIIEGTQLMTVLKDTRKLGEIAVDTAIKLAKGEVVAEDTKLYNGKINVPAIFYQPIAVDKSNIDSVLIASGFYKKEDVYNKRNIFFYGYQML